MNEEKNGGCLAHAKQPRLNCGLDNTVVSLIMLGC